MKNKFYVLLFFALSMVLWSRQAQANVDICMSVSGNVLTVTYYPNSDYNMLPFNVWNVQGFTLRYPSAASVTWSNLQNPTSFPFVEDPISSGEGADGGDGYKYKLFNTGAVTGMMQNMTSGTPLVVMTVEVTAASSFDFELIEGVPWTMVNGGEPVVENAITFNQFGAFTTDCGSQTYVPCDVSTTMIEAADICVGDDGNVTINAGMLNDGDYTFTYNLDEPNESNGISSSITIASGTGTLVIPADSLQNDTAFQVITITGIESMAGCMETGLAISDTFAIEGPITITSQPVDSTICENNDAAFFVSADIGFGSLEYQWQMREHPDSLFKDIVGEINDTLDLLAATASMDGFEYRVLINSDLCSIVTSDTATLYIDLTDADMDGFCSVDDPDDGDPCVPDATDADMDGVCDTVDPDPSDPCNPNGISAGVLAGDDTVCAGTSVDLTVTITATAAGPYTVVYNDGSSDITVTNYNSGDAISVNPATTTTYTLVSISAPNGCEVTTGLSGTATVTIDMTDVDGDGVCSAEDPNDNDPCDPDATDADMDGTCDSVDPDPSDPCNPNGISAGVLAGDDTVCAGTSVDLTVTITATAAGPYTVVYNDGSSDITVTNYNSGDAISVSPATTTTYALVSISAPNGCEVTTGLSGTATVTIDMTDADGDGVCSAEDPNDNDPCDPDATDADMDGTCDSVDPDPSDPCNPNGISAGVLAGDDTVCAGTSVDLTVTITATASGPYTVVYNDGTTDITETNYTSGDAISVSPATTTTYTLVSISAPNGCEVTTGLSGTATVTIDMTDADGDGVCSAEDPNDNDPCDPDATDADMDGVCDSVDPDPSDPCNPDGISAGVLAGDDTVCAGTSVDLTVTITATASGPYTVVYNDGTTDITETNYTSGDAISVSPATTTTYTLVSISAPNGCEVTTGLSGTATVTIDMTDADGDGVCSAEDPNDNDPCDPDATDADMDGTCDSVDPDPSDPCNPNGISAGVLAGDDTVCAGTSVDLTVTITASAAGPYTVVYNDGTTDITETNYTSGDAISVSPATTTTYTLVSISAPNGCEVTTGLSGTATVTIDMTDADGDGVCSAEDPNDNDPCDPDATDADMDGVCDSVDPDPSDPCNPDGISAGVLAGDDTVCAGTSVDLTVTITATAAGPYTVVYNDGSSDITVTNYNSGDAISVSPATTTTYTLVSISAPNGCEVTTGLSGTATVTIDMTDADGDGVCSAEDPNDNDPCDPDATDADMDGTCDSVDPDPSDPCNPNGISAGVLAGDASICFGESTDLTVTITAAASGPYTVVYNDGTSDVTVTGYTSGDAITVSPAATTSYSLVSITAPNGCEVMTGLTGTPTVTIEGPVLITKPPTDKVACEGDDVVFTVTAMGGDGTLNFQWQVSTDNGSSFTDLPGENSDALMLSGVTASMNGNQYRVLVGTGACPQIASGAALLTVEGPVVISDHPDDQALCAGEMVSFSVTADGGVGTLSYQWQVSTDGGSTFNDLPGETDATLEFLSVSSSMNGSQYHVLVSTDACAAVTSDPATLTVEGPINFTSQPSDVSTCAGGNASFSALANNGGAGSLTFKWEESTDGGSTWNELSDNFQYAGTNSVSLTISNVPVGFDGNQYRLKATTGLCAEVYSNSANLNIEGPINISTQPVDETVCAGEDVSFNIAATGGSGSLSYQWQVSTDSGSSWSDISGETGTSLALTAVTAGMSGNQYRVVINTALCAEVESSVATLIADDTDTDGDGVCDAVDPNPTDPCDPDATDADMDGVCDSVDPDPGDPCNPDGISAGVIAGDDTVCAGTSVDLTVTITATAAGPYTVVYNDGSSDITVTNYNSGDAISVSPATTTTYTLVSISAPNGCEVTSGLSGTATVTIDMTDADGDGVCSAEDPNDNDPCDPDATDADMDGVCDSVDPDPSDPCNPDGISAGVIAGDDTVCAGTSVDVTVTITATAAGPYTVVYNDGSSDITVTNYNSGDAISVSPATTTTYTLVSISAPNGCEVTSGLSGTATVTIDMTDADGDGVCSVEDPNDNDPCDPDATDADMDGVCDSVDPDPSDPCNPDGISAGVLAGDDTVCAGTSVDLTVTITATAAGPYTVVYNDGSSDITVTNFNSGDAISVSPATTTTYTLVSISAPNGCEVTSGLSGTATVTIDMTDTDGDGVCDTEDPNPNDPCDPDATDADMDGVCDSVDPDPSDPCNPDGISAGVIAGDNTVCAGTSVDLTVTITATAAGPYTVVYNDGSSDVTVTNYTSGDAISVSPATTTTYTLVSISAPNGCEVTSGLSGTATVTIDMTDADGDGVCSVEDPNDNDPCDPDATDADMDGVCDSVDPDPSDPCNPDGISAGVIAGDDTVCAGTSVDLTVTITAIAAGPYTVVYNDGTSDITVTNYNSGDAISVSPATTTTYTLVSISAPNGCEVTSGLSGTATVTIDMTDADGDGICSVEDPNDNDPCDPDATDADMDGVCDSVDPDPSDPCDPDGISAGVLAGDDTVCAGTSVDLTVTITATAAGPYTVVYNDGTSDITVTNYNSGDAISVSPATTTTYTLVSISAPNGCEVTSGLSGTATVTIDMTDADGDGICSVEDPNDNDPCDPDATDADMDGVCDSVDPDPSDPCDPNGISAGSIAGDATVCAGTSTDLTVTIVASAPGPFTVVYNDGTTDVTVTNYSSGDAISVTPSVTTTYTLVDISAANGCMMADGLIGAAVVTVDGTDTDGDGVCDTEDPDPNDPCVPDGTDADMDGVCDSVDPDPSDPCNPDGISAGVLAGDDTVCAGTSVDLTVTITASAAGPYTVVYNDGTSDVTVTNYNSGDAISVSPATTTTYTLVSISAPNGCEVTSGLSGTATVTIDMTDADGDGVCSVEDPNDNDPCDPDATDADMDGVCDSVDPDPSDPCDPDGISAGVLAGDDTVCAGTSVDLTVTITATAAGPYTVVYNDGTSDITVTNYNSGDAIAVSPATTTTYTLVSISAPNGCEVTSGLSGMATVTVDMTDADGDGICSVEDPNDNDPCDPDATDADMDGVCDSVDPDPSDPCDPNGISAGSIAGDATVCAGTSTDLTVTIVASAPGPFTVVYNDGTTDVTVTNYSSGDAISVTPSVTTTYTLVDISAANGCMMADGLIGAAVVTVDGTDTDGDGVCDTEDPDPNDPCVPDGTDADMDGVCDSVDPDPSDPCNPDGISAGVLAGDDTVCAGTSVDLTVTITASAAGPYTVVYNDGTSDVTVTNYNSGDAISVSPATTTTYTLVSISAPNGCEVTSGLSGTATVTIDMTDADGDGVCSVEDPNDNDPCDPDATDADMDGVCDSVDPDPSDPCDPDGISAGVLAGDDTVCAGTSVDLTVTITATAAGPYTVVYNDGSSDITVTNFNSGDAISVSPATTTTYTLVSISAPNGCEVTSGLSGTATVTIDMTDTDGDGVCDTEDPNPNDPCDPDATDADMDGVCDSVDPDPSDPCNPDGISAGVLAGDDTVCAGTSVDLTVTITATAAGPYTVVYNDGTSDVTVTNYTSGDAIAVSPATTTTYTLVSISAPNGCEVTSGLSGTATVTIDLTDADGDGVCSVDDPNDNDPCDPDATDADMDGVCDSVDPDPSDPCDPNGISAGVLSGNATVCAGTSTNLTVTIVAAAPGPFTVIYNDGTSDVTVTNYTSDDPIPVNPTVTTTYTLVGISAANGCMMADGLVGTPTVTVDETDTDGDGVCDTEDPNPNDPCDPDNTDADMDGTCDTVDPDPSDPCVPDNTDADMDGTCDTVDPDPSDPCVPDDTDADMDGTCDTVDPDPSDPCVPDNTDADMDGICDTVDPDPSDPCVPDGVDADMDGTCDTVDPDPSDPCVPDNTDADMDGTCDTVDPDPSDPCVPDGTDADEDGVCDTVDPDPTDPCNPSTGSSACQVSVSVDVFLQGAYVSADGLMQDNLRSNGLIPTTEPYTAMASFTHVGVGGGETTTSAVLAVTGDDAIVDWVFLELRDVAGQVIATRSALVQRDGDVVDVDGVSPVAFGQIMADDYSIAVRHRNHLGVVTSNTFALGTSTTDIDLTAGSIPLYGSNAQVDLGDGNFGLWAGNTNVDGMIIDSGIATDQNLITVKVLTDPANSSFSLNHQVNGYHVEDLNMNGVVSIMGADNDRQVIVDNVLGHPLNLTNSWTFIILEQLP